jgi:hypothetical protein
MRIGQNPMKYSRKSNGQARIYYKKPSKITACTITYVPFLDNYYSEGLEILKLSILSLRDNNIKDLDIVVYDNGSCKEVIDWLQKQLKDNVIQQLYLSSENRKKLGAWNHLFPSALGEYVYYFDSDIFHKKDSIEKMLEVLKYFNNHKISLVTCNHNIPVATMKKSENNISFKNNKIKILKDNFLSKEELYKVGRTMTDQVDIWLKKKMKNKETKVIFENKYEAYLGGAHAQFLIKTNVLNEIFPITIDRAANQDDSTFEDIFFSKKGIKLTTIENLVIHMGNHIDDFLRDELTKLSTKVKLSNQKIHTIKLPKLLLYFLKIPIIKTIIKKLYNFLFKIIYNIY